MLITVLLCRKKDDSGETELISDTFVDPNKYCPPNINDYTSVEVEELLAGKVDLGIKYS